MPRLRYPVVANGSLCSGVVKSSDTKVNMFERLRRAKSFIHKPKQPPELDLSESSHLKRNKVIDGAVIAQQYALRGSQETVHHVESTRVLRRQASRSHEHLHDETLEKMRQKNFGDSYSKKDAQKLLQPREFPRGHPAFLSQRSYHRRSFTEESSESSKVTHGDAVANHNFPRNNRMYRSDRPSHQPVSGTSGDFLLQRPGVRAGHKLETRERNPPFVVKPQLTRTKSDLLERSGLRSLFQKLKTAHKTADVTEDTGSFTYVPVEPARRQRQETAGSRSDCSNTSTASSSGTQTPSDIKTDTTRLDSRDTEISRKRQHDRTKSNFDRTRGVYCSVRVSAESRKKSGVDVIKRGKDPG